MKAEHARILENQFVADIEVFGLDAAVENLIENAYDSKLEFLADAYNNSHILSDEPEDSIRYKLRQCCIDLMQDYLLTIGDEDDAEC